MKGLWLENKQLKVRTDLALPALCEGEALIKPSLAGICSTDLEMVKGYYPFAGIPGHEFVGTVVKAPEHEYLEGKRVVGNINITCGSCKACLAGRKTHCENRKTLGIFDYNGVFSDYFKLPVENCYLVPDCVSDEKAVFTELLAAAIQITAQTHIKPTDKVIVVGAGRLGLLIAQVLNNIGADVTMIVRRPEPAKLLDNWGIHWAYAQDVPSHGADVVIEATGSAGGFALSQTLVRPAGKLILKSTFAGDVQVNLSSLVVNEIEIIGSRCGPMDAALRMLERGLIKTDDLISAAFPIENGLEAFEKASEHGVLKVLIRF